MIRIVDEKTGAQVRPPLTPKLALPAYVERDDYDAIDALNWSSLKLMSKSPAHYRDNLLRTSPDTDARKLGRAVHLAVFEPERFRSECVVWPDRRAGKEWEAFRSRNSDREILTEAMSKTAVTLGQAARSSAMALPYLSGGSGEVTIQWEHASAILEGIEPYRFRCKGRLDFVKSDVIADLKTTRDASPSGFAREVLRYEYHVQAAWYVDGMKAAYGVELPYVIIAVETAAPHVVQVYRVCDEELQLGRERYRALLDQLNHCRKTNSWPGYAETEMNLSLPRWARPLEDDAELDSDLVIGG